MSNNVVGLPTEKLNELLQQCWPTINAILDRLTDDQEMQTGIQRLVNSANMVTEFCTIKAETPKLANLILEASIAMLANTHSIQAIDAAIARRASAGN